MKVLVVEDGRTTRMMLRAAVEGLGHECLTAADGSEAWELFRTRVPTSSSALAHAGSEGPERVRMVRQFGTVHVLICSPHATTRPMPWKDAGRRGRLTVQETA